MGRHKKNTAVAVDIPVLLETESKVVPSDEIPTVTKLNSVPPIPWNRNYYGLYEHINYNFNKLGFVDWKSMISSEHVVLNRENFLKKDNPIDVDTLSEEEAEALKQKSHDKDKLIKLSGYREVAQLRGFISIENESKFIPELNGAYSKCIITWTPNYEQNYEKVVSCGIADANTENTMGVPSKYLFCIAENRAFVRAVRQFLQINIAGQDEIKTEVPEDFRNSVAPTNTLSGPQGALDKKLKDKKRGFNELVQFAVTKYSDKLTGAELWSSVKDIQGSDAAFLLGKFDEFLVRE